MLVPIRTLAPLTMPVSLEDARQQLIVFGFTDDDKQIERFIWAATESLEKTLNIALVTQVWRQMFGSFNDTMLLRVGPVSKIKAITYFDAGNVEQTLDAGSYNALTYVHGTVVNFTFGNSPPATFNRLDAVSVEYEAGAPADGVSPSLKVAILMHVGLMYSYRGDPEGPRIESNAAYEELIWHFRRPKV